MKKSLLLVCLLGGATLMQAQAQTSPRPRRTGSFTTADPGVHDPVMAKEGDTYYLFATGMGVQTMSSKDLVTWTSENSVLKETFPWTKKDLPSFRGLHLWAPDVIYYRGQYHLFYCCSAFGKNTSVIGHVSRKTLDPNDPSPWVDKGKVVQSFPMQDNWNAIDPNVIVDDKGQPWMTWGSFWDGIQLARMSRDLNKLTEKPRTIARRNFTAHGEKRVNAGDNAIEAPFIFRHGDYYYLFVSWDYCCRGNSSTYKVAVGRSKTVAGPYLDRDGKDMAEGGGTVVLYNNEEFNAAGHNSAYHFDGKDYFVCHAYSRKAHGGSKLIVREMKWDAEGWPLVDLNAPVAKKPTTPTLSVNLRQRGAAVNPGMYGIFFEEINHSGDGSLYGELLQNRNFEEHVVPSGCTYRDGFAYAPHLPNYGRPGAYSDWRTPWNPDSLKYVGWKIEGEATHDVVDNMPLHPNTPNALKLTLKKKDVRLVNSGYWGVPVKAGDKYDLRFYLYPEKYKGDVTARVVSSTGAVLAEQQFKVTEQGKWTEFTAELTASATDAKCTFQLQFAKKGSLYVDYVSLFPQKTFKGRKNGLRADVAQTLADLHPGFVRWPGGCIVEGATQKNGFHWKNTIGDPMTRKSEWVLWNYHCSWGFGYHEFLQFCEDIGAAPMFVAHVGLSCTLRNGDYVMDKDSLKRYIQDVCDAIDYATAPASNKWGALRAAAGHPEPFALKYVEIGNEQVGPVYAETYKMFYSVLKEKYPQITFINAMGFDTQYVANSGKVDMIDPHWYVGPDFFHSNTNFFDQKERGKYEVYVGEYAAISAGNMQGALSEAAWNMGMERNSDLVKIASYAPLIENVNRRDWPTNMIWVSNDKVMGRTSYYVQQMFAENIPTYNVAASLVLPAAKSLTDGYIGFAGGQTEHKVRSLKVVENGAVSFEKAAFEPSAPAANNAPQMGRRRFVAPPQMIADKSFANAVVLFEFCPQPVVSGGNAQNAPVRGGNTSLVFGADKETRNFYQLNINNNTFTISQTVDGRNVNLTQNEGAFTFEPGVWYNMRVEFSYGENVSVYVNGNKAWETKLRPFSTFHAIAGYDSEAGETIIKIVNGDGKAVTMPISLTCDEVASQGKVVVMKSATVNGENSLDEPTKISPVKSNYNGFAKSFSYTFEPYSLTVLRIKSK